MENLDKKSTAELRQEYEFLKYLLEFHIANKTMDTASKEWENYQNAALEWMMAIRKELEKREESL